VFGNYVIQKLLQHGNADIVAKLTAQLVPKALELSLHNYGCRVIQRAIEMSDEHGRNTILQQLEGREAQLLQDSKGNHVIQKCIQTMRGGLTLAILELFKSPEDCVNFAQHEYGCRVVQRILEHCSPQQVEPVLGCVLSNVIELSMNQFGNYVIQHLLQNGNERIFDAISRQLKGQVLAMSLHKFASNVIEKALMVPELCSRVVEESIQAPNVDNDTEEGDEELEDSPLVQMMKDQYGNYVVQKMLEHAAPTHRGCLLQSVQEAATQLKQGSFSIHILNLVERLVE
jgi:pumilio RNA-binding family